MFLQFIFVLHLCISLVSGQYFSSGFYQGGFRATGFSPFAFQGHPFGGGRGHPGLGGGHGHTHVHYHVPVSEHHGGFGGGGLGLGVNTRDLGSGRFMTFHAKILLKLALNTNQLKIKICQGLARGRWFSLGLQVSSTNKIDRHDIT